MRSDLGADDVHVWIIDLDGPAGDADTGTLSCDEAEQSERFATPQLRRRYRRAHAAMRALLAAYTGQTHAQLHLARGASGKPFLPHSLLHFNLSHSASHALLAVAMQPVGVDLEWRERSDIDCDELIALVCHPREAQELHAMPSTERARGFYRVWTRKEAYCKATGDGMLGDLPAICVNGPCVVDEAKPDGRRWYLYDLDCLDGYAVSVCLGSATAKITIRS